MNFEFNKENIVTLFFNSDEREHITVIYRDENDKDCVYNLRVRSADKDFQYLLTLYTMEEIEQKTVDHISGLWQAQKQMQKELIEAGEVSIESAQSQSDESIRDKIFEASVLTADEIQTGELDEILFEVKLQLFDLPEVIDAPVEVKENIRMATSIPEAMHYLYEYRCSESSSPADDTDQE